MKNFRLGLLCSAILAAAMTLAAQLVSTQPDWLLGPFKKADAANPILKPLPESSFHCPVTGKTVEWESLYVYNPATIVKDKKVYLLYRAQGKMDGKINLVSRVGLAESEDGVHFKRLPEPVLYPDNDFMKRYEWPGGCEDPRIVQDEQGTFYLTYTAFDGKIARLCVATSQDLVHWTKRGPVFAKTLGGKYLNIWSKSGAIVTGFKDGRQIARKINGKYWMYWGDSDIFIATSDNLIDWTPVESKEKQRSSMLKQFGASHLQRLITTRKGNFDSGLVESGPPPFATDQRILFIYNSKNKDFPGLPKSAYAAGQVLIDPADPTRVLARTDSYFISPDQPFEKTGQVNNVVFVEGFLRFKDRLLLYYGMADTDIGVAVAP